MLNKWPKLQITYCKRCSRAIVSTIETNAPQARSRWGSICEDCLTEQEKWQQTTEIGRELAKNARH